VRTITKQLVLTAALLISLGGVAQADLIGDLVDVEYVWPSLGSVYSDVGTITVTPTPQTVSFEGIFGVTISGSQIVVGGATFDSGTYTGTFNGQYLVDESVATFPDYTVDPSSVLPEEPRASRLTATYWKSTSPA